MPGSNGTGGQSADAAPSTAGEAAAASESATDEARSHEGGQRREPRQRNRQGGQQGGQQGDRQQGDRQQGDRQQGRTASRATQPPGRPAGRQNRPGQPSRRPAGQPAEPAATTGTAADDDDDGSRRGRRNRYRDRKRRGRPGGGDLPGQYDEPEITEDDVLVPVAGILDVLDNYAFVRTSGYLPGPNDVYVSLGQVKKNGLRKGDAVTGAVRAAARGRAAEPAAEVQRPGPAGHRQRHDRRSRPRPASSSAS